MSELAVNQHGETFLVTQETTHWMVRRMSDVPRGGPLPTFDADGRPIVIPIETTVAQFHQVLRDHGCTPGKYRLDPVDRTGRPVKGTAAYLPFPPGRKAAPGPRVDEPAEADRPRNGNVASMPFAMPATAAWSTGGAFPLPVPMHLTGAEYIFAEQMRGQMQLQMVQAQVQAQAFMHLASQAGGLMHAAADLLRAADGASLPKRRPMAEREAPRPQVIVQQVAPPMMYDDEPEDEAPEPMPAKPPAWTDKLGDVFGELAPMAKMMIQSKLADLVGGGGGGDLGGLGAILGGMMPGGVPAVPRNAAPVMPPVREPEADEPEPDLTAEALECLGCVLERLGGERAGRALRDELRHMDADARVAFALDLLPLSIDDACEEAVAKVAGIRVRRTRAMIAAERARGQVVTREYDGSELVPFEEVPTETAPTAPPAEPAADAPVTYTETTEEPADAIPTPGYEHVRTTVGPTGSRLSHYRPITAPRAAPLATPSVTTAPIVAAMPGAGLATLLQSVQAGRDAALGNLIGAFPGGAAGIEASLAQLPPEIAGQLKAALAATTTTSSPTAAPAAPVAQAAPAAPQAAPQAAMARMAEILPHIAPEERTTAQVIAMSLPADKRGLLMTKLVSVPLPQAVAIVKDILATHAAHGSPYR